MGFQLLIRACHIQTVLPVRLQVIFSLKNVWAPSRFPWCRTNPCLILHTAQLKAMSTSVVQFVAHVSEERQFVCAFAKLRRASISFAMSVLPPVCPHWKTRLSMEVSYLSIFRKSVEKIQVSSKSDKNNGYYTWRQIYIFLSYLAHFFLERKMFQTKVVEKLETHILCSIIFFSVENLTVYEIMWKNIVERGRPQMTIWHMLIACWIHKATNTHTGRVIFIVFPLQQWQHEHYSMVRYTGLLKMTVGVLTTCHTQCTWDRNI